MPKGKDEPAKDKAPKEEPAKGKGAGAKGASKDAPALELDEPEEEVELEEPEELDVPGLEVPAGVEDAEDPEPIRPAPARRGGPKELTGGEPPGLQERFSARSRALFAATKAVAGKLGHDAATTGHLLAAILAEDAGIAQDIFSDVNAFPDMFEEEMARIREIPAAPTGHWLDAQVELAVKRGLDAAEALASPAVEPEHILLGLLSLPQGPAAAILDEFSLDRVDMRDEVLAMLGADIGRFPDWEKGRNLRRKPKRG